MAMTIKKLKEHGAKTVDDIDSAIEGDKDAYKKLPSYHAIILAKDYVGLKNLYKLVSYAHLWNYYKRPKINRSMLRRYREGLIVGSACERGELYQAIFKEKTGTNLDDFDSLKDIVDFYDYLEIQPLGNNEFYTRKGIKIKKEDGEDEYVKLSHQDLIDINKQIISLADEAGKPCVATCDVHFMDPQDEIYRRILMAGQGYDDADDQAPLYLRTTEEMLDETWTLFRKYFKIEEVNIKKEFTDIYWK